MMGIHKLSSGNGYTYLTKQTTVNDSTELLGGKKKSVQADSTALSGKAMADYYSEKGERPGHWLGSGLVGVAGVNEGQTVTEEQMKALFGEGRHPDAAAMTSAAIAEGTAPEAAMKATELGSPYKELDDKPSEFLVGTTRRYNAWLAANGKSRKDSIPDDIRAAIRTEVGNETFEELHGRKPLDQRELSSHIARMSRPRKQTVAGYDLTFSPVKSFSVLWGLAPLPIAEQLQDAHDAAVKDALSFLEDEVLYSRRGKGGVRVVEVKGMVATAFTHRDSRAGEPDLHTHVAVANKVQDPTDGKWLSIDGQVLYKATVAASERYNRALEREVNVRLGLEFENRGGTRAGKRPVREIIGMPAELLTAFSSRRKDIEERQAVLTAEFRRAHGRAPNQKEARDLAQQANLETREAKHEPRSLGEQRDSWWRSALAVIGGQERLDGAINAVLARVQHRTATLTDDEIRELASRVIDTTQQARARFQTDHLAGEIDRQLKAKKLDPATESDVARQVLQVCLGDENIVRLDPADPIVDPPKLRRSDGTSVYDKPRARMFTTTRIEAAEASVVQAAHITNDSAVSPGIVAASLTEQLRSGKPLNAAQVQLVSEMATSGKFLQLALAPAGSGKTTSMRVLANAWNTAHPATGRGQHRGGGVIGLAPTAVAATELGDSINTRADTLAKLVWHIEKGGVPAPDSVEAVSGESGIPDWMTSIGPDTLLIVDEAGMASTLDLATVTEFARMRGATVRLIGDDQQLASVAAGGVLRDVAATAGAITLSELVRFKTAGEAAATLSLREGDTAALGFYLDNDRVTVTGDADQADTVYAAWRDTMKKHPALMLAYSRDTVTSLNERARADRIRDGLVDGGPARVKLADDSYASAGDVIVTRQNKRTKGFWLTRTDFVKNGDRWTVQEVAADGRLTVQHERLGRTITLPADYVSESINLGYASTIHGAQGQTVHSSYVLLRGDETRQLLYVAMSRGEHRNQMFVPAGGDGDPHKDLQEDRVMPATQVEFLEKILRHDGSQVSATTERRRQNDPVMLAARAAERYADALGFAAVDRVGDKRIKEFTTAAEQAVDGVTNAPAWETLLAHLAILDLQGRNPITELQAAAGHRELDTARDTAAVLDWRLDPTTGHSSGHGPLPWLPGVPDQLRTDDEYGQMLTDRDGQVRDYVTGVRDQAKAWAPEDAPEWATALVDAPEVLADVAVWRAIHRVPEDDTTPTGPPHPAVRERRYQDALLQRVKSVTGAQEVHGEAFRDLLTEQAPAVLTDTWWPVLAEHLDLAAAGGLPVDEHLTTALADGPLPDEYAAAALWSRVGKIISPTAAVHAITGSGATRLRPPWTPALLDALPHGIGARVLADPHWPDLVAAIGAAAATTGLDPADVITRAVDLIGTEHMPHLPGDPDAPDTDGPAPIPLPALATVLAWRVTDLSTPPPAEDDGEHLVSEDDLRDAEIDDFLADWSAEHDAAEGPTPRDTVTTTGTDAPEPPDEDLVDPGHEPQPEPGPSTSNERILELVAEAGRYYADQYPGSPAQTYLTERFGVDPAEQGFTIGYAGRDKMGVANHLHHTMGATAQELDDAGLARWAPWGEFTDLFRDRVLIGFHNADGDLVGFNGRDLTGKSSRKYFNTPATPVFRKRELLFGLREGLAYAADRDVDSPDVVGVEGPMDAIAISLAGGGQVIGASTGTAAFSSEQADQLVDHVDDQNRIWLSKDNDSAGRRAMIKDFDQFIARGIDPRSLLVAGKDPAEMWHDDPDTLRTLLEVRGEAQSAVADVAQAIAHRYTEPAKNEKPLTYSEAVAWVGTELAKLPPQEWEREADYAAFVLAQAEGAEALAPFHAEEIYASMFAAALNWDPRMREPKPSDPAYRDPVQAVSNIAALTERVNNVLPPELVQSGTDALTQRIDDIAKLIEERQRAQQEAAKKSQPRRRRDDISATQDRRGPSIT